MMNLIQWRRCSLAAACILLLIQSVWAEQQGTVRELKVEVVQGNGARNVAGRQQPAPLSVRVLDQDGHPVSGANVVFSAPETGAGGVFSNGTAVLVTTTDDKGVASARFQPNTTEGDYNVHVLARQVLVTAIADIRQSNVPAGSVGSAGSSPKKPTKMWALLAIAGGAAVAGIALGHGGGSNNGGPSTPTTPSNAPTITFGGSTVSGPQ